VVVRHVWGRPCHLAPPLLVRLSLSDRVGRRVRLAAFDEAHPAVQARVGGDFSPGFEHSSTFPTSPSRNLAKAATGRDRSRPS
jgi:hypothetical protein